jgi:hypothetical protein
MVIEVPIDLQSYALALDRTEPAEEMLSWLVREDLLTSDYFAEMDDDEDFGLSESETAELEVLLDLDRPTETAAIETLGGFFHTSESRLPVRVRCRWPVGFPGVEVLRQIVAEARRLAAENRRAIAFEMTFAIQSLDEATVRYLVGESFPVWVLVGLLNAAEIEPTITRDLEALSARFGDLLTLWVELARDVRLRDAWRLAETSGVRHFDATWAPGAEPTIGGDLRDLKTDLQHISDDIHAALWAHRPPIDFKTLTRVVGRLIQREPIFDFERELSHRPAWFGDVDSRLGLRNMEIWTRVEELDGETGTAMACESCWARYFCPESRLLPTFAEASEPEERRCHVLRSQYEAGVRLYYWLGQMDPLATVQFLELALRASSESGRGAENSNTENRSRE